MMTENRISVFIDSLDPGNTPFLEDLAARAREAGVPIIRRGTQSFMRSLLTCTRPRKVLEVGTAVGFSSILMATYGPSDMKIVTIENSHDRAEEARRNIGMAGFEQKIDLIEGDAEAVLKTLTDPFDFVFMDAAKGQYINFLPDVKRLMHSGSVLLSDNILQEGDILESHYIVERRKRTIYKRMREYLLALKEDPELETCILSTGDGMAFSVMR